MYKQQEDCKEKTFTFYLVVPFNSIIGPVEKTNKGIRVRKGSCCDSEYMCMVKVPGSIFSISNSKPLR